MKVGVFDMGGAGWTGGVTYLRNLGHAVRTTIPERLNLFLIRKTDSPAGKDDPVSGYFDGVVRVTPFARSPRSPLEYIRKGVALLAGGDILNARRFEKIFRQEGIEVLFGNGLTNRYTLPSVGWFPDFQHVDLPGFFNRNEILTRGLLVKRMACNCTLMVFSSQHARNIFAKLQPSWVHKARVLNFVAHLPAAVVKVDPVYVLAKHGIPEKFIYLPNQLWMHKNHLTAFKAVKILADRKVPVSLVCTGNLTTNAQNPAYRDEVFRYVRDNGLTDRIFLLGMVDFDDVYALIRQSCCVLNPSLYEGWSTTVEETKTIGKPMILSDIEVHREQNPPETIFFEPKNAEMLAAAMESVWNAHSSGPDYRMEESAARDYPIRARQFARTFADICSEAANSARGSCG